MAKYSPTVPDAEVDVVPGKGVIEPLLICIVIMMEHAKILQLSKYGVLWQDV